MPRSVIIAIVALLALFVSTPAWAKRSPPAEVPPLRVDKVEYRVRHRAAEGYLPGFVEAWDVAKNERVWQRQIYVIRRNPDLEQDVQDVFITSLKPISAGRALEVKNERGDVYELNLETLEVKVVHGQAVIYHK